MPIVDVVIPRSPQNPRFTESSRSGRRRTIDEMQTVLDQYLVEYNTKRPHQGRGMNGRTPITAFIRKENTPQLNQIRKAA